MSTLDGLPSLVGPGADQPAEVAIPAGDLDGDGRGDLVVGVPSDDAGGDAAGAVYVLYDVAGIGPFTPIADVAVRLVGARTGDRAGFAVAALGDVDGDGAVDVAVGAPEATAEFVAGGRVYLLYGGDPLVAGSLVDQVSLVGGDRHARIGARVFGPGDVDDDGLAELLIGAPYPTPSGVLGAGFIALVRGRAGGLPDGQAIIVSADLTTTATTADVGFLVRQSYSLFGRAAAVVPDLDGDGLDDLVVGSPGYNPDGLDLEPGEGPGALVLLPIPAVADEPIVVTDDALIGTIDGAFADDGVAWQVLTLPNGGIALSGPGHDVGAGQVWRFDAVVAGLSVDDAAATWVGDTPGALLGQGLAWTDQFGGTLAIGQPGAGDRGEGRVIVVGDEGGPLADALATLDGCWPGGQAGSWLATAPGPDPIGADRPWTAITAPGASVNADQDGLVYVLTADHVGATDGTCGEVAGWEPAVDLDGDGYAAAVDCDDTEAHRYPDAPEVCGDRLDDDCDGEADDGCATVGCGCATGQGPPIGWVLAVSMAIVVLAGRRFRRVERSAVSGQRSARSEAAGGLENDHHGVTKARRGHLGPTCGMHIHQNRSGPTGCGSIRILVYRGICPDRRAIGRDKAPSSWTLSPCSLRQLDFSGFGGHTWRKMRFRPWRTERRTAGSAEKSNWRRLHRRVVQLAGTPPGDFVALWWPGRAPVTRWGWFAALALTATAGAADAPIDVLPIATLYGPTAYASLRGPVIGGDFDGDGEIDVAVANPQGIVERFSTGAVIVVPHALVRGPVDLMAGTVLAGDSEHDRFGIAAIVVPSVAPGAPDGLLIGADHTGLTELDEGQALLWRDPLALPPITHAADADYAIGGDDREDALGAQLARGDFDGDGLDDLAIAAPYRDTAGTDALIEHTGRVWVVHGGLVGPFGARKIERVATATIDGHLANSYVGWRLLCPGDLDGDGRDDLIVGSLGGQPRAAGRLAHFPGIERDEALTIEQSAGAWVGDERDGRLGEALTSGTIGGRTVVLVGSPRIGTGRVWRFDGPPQGQASPNAAADAIWNGPDGEGAGASVAVGPRILVGAPEAGRIYVLDDDLTGDFVLGGGGRAGESVSWLRDLDGDGVDDAAIVDPAYSGELRNQGRVVILSGAKLVAGDLPDGRPPDDFDGDGAVAGEDCDDGDPRRAPGREDTCRTGLDEDCDGVVDEPCGCATVGGGGLLAVALSALLVRRRRVALLVLAGCGGDELAAPTLIVPPDPLFGVVEGRASADAERLIVAVDGVTIAGGPGPDVTFAIDTRELADGPHLVRATAFAGEASADAWQEVDVVQAAGDREAPRVRFLSPREGEVFVGEGPYIVLDVGDDVGIAHVEVLVGDVLLGTLPPDGPYELAWADAPVGTWRLIAAVVDHADHAASADVRIVVGEVE